METFIGKIYCHNHTSKVVNKLQKGYLPTNQERRQATLERKRAEYKDLTPLYYDVKEGKQTTEEDAATYHQVESHQLIFSLFP